MPFESWFDTGREVFAKRNNLFLVEFNPTLNENYSFDKEFMKPITGIAHTAKSVNLPSISVTEQGKEIIPIGGEELVIQPGFIDWQPVTIVFNDIISRPEFSTDNVDNAALARAETQTKKDKIIRKSAFGKGKFNDFYHSLLYLVRRGISEQDNDGHTAYQGGSAYLAKRFARKFGDVNIITLDEYGGWLEKWTLHDVFFKEFKSPDLTYENSNIREFSITLDYIVASLTIYNADGSERLTLFEKIGKTNFKKQPHNPGISR